MHNQLKPFARIALAALALILGNVHSGSAQDTLSVAARLVARQPTGAILRIQADNQQVSGPLDRVADGTVFLGVPSRAIPLGSITDAWLQRRSTGRGGRIGAVVGASAGAAIIGAGYAVLSQLCESDCSDGGAGDVLVATLIGGAAGGAAGYLVGSIIGASVPRWERLTESSAPASVVRNASQPPGLSALSISAGAARAAAHDDAAFMLSASYLSQLSSHIAVGGEITRFGIATGPVPVLPCSEVPCESTVSDGSGWSAGGLGRLGAGAGRTVEPYALLGLGVTDFGSVTLGSYTAGGGVRIRAGSAVGVSGEARWHSNFTNSGDDSQLGLYTIGITLSLLR